MLDTRIQRMLEEIIFEKHEETKQLKKKVAELEKQRSDYASDALQTSFQLASANELLERESKEKETLKAENKRLKKQIVELKSYKKDIEIAYEDRLFTMLAHEHTIAELKAENKRLKAQVKELQSAKIRDGNAYVDHLYRVIAQERAERECREKQVAELKGLLAKSQRIVDEEFP